MDINLQEWVKENLIGKTGKIVSTKILKRWFIKYNYANIYNQIINRTKYLKECKFSERIYHIINDLYSNKICKNKNCTKTVNFITFQDGYNSYCSLACSSQSQETKNKVKNTFYRKYGVDHIFQSEKYKKRFKETNLKKYGVEYPMQSKEIQSKAKKTNIIKYGSKSALGNKEIKEKFVKTSIERYGKEHPAQTAEFQNKRKKTCLEKYGVENPLQSKEIQEKAFASNIRRFGTKYASQSELFANKVRQTCYKKYGVKWPIQKHLLKETFDKLGSKNWLEKEYKNKRGGQIAGELKVSPRTVYNYLRYHKLPINHYYSSSVSEREIAKFINIDNIKINTKKIISPLELDIYLPDYNLAIEFDGIYWHSDKPKNYHLIKTQTCKEKGIQLFHIFENEWLDSIKQEIWKSIISNKLGRNERIYARKCEIREVNSREFIENNHLQGFIGSSIKLGLFYKDELVSLMTFGKTRFNKKYEWEMIRFCNKKFVSIVGAASKLFKFFIRNYNPKSIVSYADRRYSDGSLYKKLGFEFSHYSNPNYFYFKLPDTTLHSRVKFQKHKLKDLLENFDPALSESKNMLNNEYRRIWDCGNAVHCWKN